MTNEDRIKSEYRNFLTSLLSQYSLLDMARFKDIVAGLSHQTTRKADELARDLEELNALRPSWQRYQELSKQIESTQRRVALGYALLFQAPIKVKADVDAFAAPDSDFYEHRALEINMDDLELSNFPLWRVMREIVRQTAEIRVYELEAHLKQFGVKASRPAIESALTTHPKEFRLRNHGREKYVSLK